MLHALVAVALAAPGPSNEPTNWGDVPTTLHTTACAAERVFVGTIVTATPYKTESSVHAPIHTDLKFSVERNLRGSGQTFAWAMPGGTMQNVTLNGKHYDLFRSDRHNLPEPQVGLRYVMFFTTLKADVPPRLAGEWLFKGAIWIDDSSALPPDAEMVASFNNECE